MDTEAVVLMLSVFGLRALLDMFGPPVILRRTLNDGTHTEQWYPAGLAVHEALHGVQNGRLVKSARVLFPDGAIDRWGSSG